MGWWSRTRPVPAPRRRFAVFQAMAPAARAAALSGPDAPHWIEAAAQYGLVEAQLLHGQGLLDRGQAELALRWFRAAAEAGHGPAVNMVGRCLELGWGTAPDPAAAARHYRQAAEAGIAWGQFNLGMVLLYGIGVPRDRPQAFTWFQCAAAQDLPKAANMLGRFHEEGWDRPRDPAQAARCYRRGAAAGDYRAQFNLATLLLPASRPAALALMRTAWAAGSADFRTEAGAALRASGDPDLAAIAA